MECSPYPADQLQPNLQLLRSLHTTQAVSPYTLRCCLLISNWSQSRAFRSKTQSPTQCSDPFPPGIRSRGLDHFLSFLPTPTHDVAELCGYELTKHSGCPCNSSDALPPPLFLLLQESSLRQVKRGGGGACHFKWGKARSPCLCRCPWEGLHGWLAAAATTAAHTPHKNCSPPYLCLFSAQW